MGKITVHYSRNISDLAALLKEYPSVFIVADRRVKRFITEPIAEICAESGVALRGVLNIRTGECRKNLRSVNVILRWLLRAGADRDSLVLAVGGGVTTDLAGFAASIYKRGIRYANVPTTLLAQVDAAVGGKTGCNVDGNKNMAGLIRQPEFTFINTDFIRTLSWDEFCEGYAELLKTFVIGDAEAYRRAVASEDFSDLEDLVRRAVKIKTALVEKDEYDRGDRRLLNLGHTFAHAMEARSARHPLRRALPGEKSLFGLTCRRISHGKAVAIGIILAAEMSERECVAVGETGVSGRSEGVTVGKTGLSEERGAEKRAGLSEGLKADFLKAGLPVECPWKTEDLLPYMRNDKKVADGKVNFVLIREIGDCLIKDVAI